jgi:inosine-uridine nucleoside N-ribohydrolase
VSSQVWIRAPDLADLATRSEAGAWIAESCASWIELWRERFGVDGFNPFDTLAVGWLTHPELVESVPVGVWIEDGPDDRAVDGEPLIKPYLLVAPHQAQQPGDRLRPASYCVRPGAGFKSLLLERLAGARGS